MILRLYFSRLFIKKGVIKMLDFKADWVFDGRGIYEGSVSGGTVKSIEDQCEVKKEVEKFPHCICGSRLVGKIGKDTYFCSECLIEFKVCKDGSKQKIYYGKEIK